MGTKQRTRRATVLIVAVGVVMVVALGYASMHEAREAAHDSTTIEASTLGSALSPARSILPPPS